jgi:multidrug efflux pump subunit AcrA (membrane-fusion protein)
MNLGATVTGSIVAPGVPVVELPATSISSIDGKPAVFVVDTATGRLSLKPVTVGRYGETSVSVLSGLDAGEHVVVAGVTKLRPGQIVSLEGGAQ